ncbi:MAG: CARDB domain-containing protein, partial [Candidatus Thermoplasmatota archaeon]|nr:CARDB domain-containing protein [Candidatus Thermoplasmatota archaeon]
MSTEMLAYGVDYTVDMDIGRVNMSLYGTPAANAIMIAHYQYIGNKDARLEYSRYESGAWTAPETIIEKNTILEPSIGCDSSGNVVAIWNGPAENYQTFWYTVLDSVTGNWSKGAVLDDGQRTAASVSMAISPNSDIILGYIKGDVVFTNGIGGLESEDLYVAVYDINADLEVTDQNIALSNNNPSAGQQIWINVTIENVGTITSPATTGQLIDDTVALTLGYCAIPALESGEKHTVSFTWTAPGDNTTHSFRFVADNNNTVVELSEANNEASQYAVLPDISILPANIAYNNTGTERIIATICNLGNADSQSFRVLVYQGAVQPASLLSNTSVASLARGASHTVEVAWTPTAGGKSIYVKLEPSSAIPDEASANNLAMKHLSFYVKLEVPNVTVDNYNPRVGDLAGIGVLLNNTGQVDATNLSVTLYDGDPSVNTSTKITNQTVNITRNAEGQITLTWAATEGEHILYLRIDPEDKFSQTITLRVYNFSVSGLPDLYCDSANASINGTKPQLGKGTEILVPVQNLGTSNAYGFTMNIYNGDPGSGGQLVQSRFVDFIGAGSTVNVSFTLVNLSAGSLTYYFVIDPENDTEEASEDNNEGTFIFYVNTPPTITATSPPATASQDVLYIYSFNATDPDLDNMTWALFTNAPWLLINATTGVVSGTPSGAQIGAYWANVTVNDGNLGVDTYNYTILVDITGTWTVSQNTTLDGFSLHFDGLILQPGVVLKITNSEIYCGQIVIGPGAVLDTAPDTIHADGSVWVDGTFILDDTEFYFNNSYHGEYGIQVNATGTLVVRNNSLIASNTTYSYWASMMPGSTALFMDSTITDCGYDTGNPGFVFQNGNFNLANMTFTGNYLDGMVYRDGNVTLVVTSADAMTQITVVESTDTPVGLTGGVSRKWDLTTDASSFTMDVIFAYQQSDLPPGLFNESTLHVYYNNAGTWTLESGTGTYRNIATNTVTLRGLSHFTEFTLGGMTMTATDITPDQAATGVDKVGILMLEFVNTGVADTLTDLVITSS